jgi:hypothetical protein
MSDRAKLSRPAWTRGPAASWVRAHRLELALALPLVTSPAHAQERLVEGNAWPAIRADAYGRVPAVQRETFEAVRRALADGWHRPGVPYCRT